MIVTFYSWERKISQIVEESILRDQIKAQEHEVKRMHDAVKIIPSLKDEIVLLRAEIRTQKAELDRMEHDSNILSNLYDMRVIDEEGNLLQQRDNNDMNYEIRN